MKEDKFKEQVIQPFKEYLKIAFREHCHLYRRFHYLLSTANDCAARKAMAHAQEAPKADSDTASAERSISEEHSTRSGEPTARKRHAENLSPSHFANEDVVENPADTGAVEGPVRAPWSWRPGLKSYQRRRPNPEDADDAEYTAENEDGVEIGASDTVRTKSNRISQQSNGAKEA
jgi:hypothetical protein